MIVIMKIVMSLIKIAYISLVNNKEMTVCVKNETNFVRKFS